MNHEDRVKDIAISPDGKYIVSGSGDGTARIWEAMTGDEIARTTHDLDVVAVAFSPDGKYVASGSYDGTAHVLEIATREELARLSHEAAVTAVGFSADGKYILTGGCDQIDVGFQCVQASVRVWEISTGNEVARILHQDMMSSVAFSPDGKYVLSGSWDSTARISLWRPDDWIADACAYLPRNLTRLEWAQYIGDGLPYQAICPGLPLEPEGTPTP